MSKTVTGTTRTERDSMGELQVPDWALWGAQTQRAVNNFPISGQVMPRAFIRALGLIKACAGPRFVTLVLSCNCLYRFLFSPIQIRA